MIYGIYSVRDDRANVYNQPFMEINDMVAMRNFDVTFHATFDHLSLYSGDLKLVRIGSFDTETGVVSSEPHTVIKSNLPEV